MILFISEISLVFGLDQDQVSILPSWSNQTYIQGKDGTIAILLDSQCPDELKINKVIIQFDWTNNQNNPILNLSDTPIGIPSNGKYLFDPIFFKVPQNATEGFHTVFVKLEGLQHGIWWYDFEWTSNETQIEIKTDYKEFFTQLNPQTTLNLTKAQNANYTNPNAIELLEKAETEYELAASYANQEEWFNAVSHLYAAQNYIDQAQEKEQTLNITEDLTTTIGVIIALVAAGLIVSIVFGRKSKKQT